MSWYWWWRAQAILNRLSSSGPCLSPSDGSDILFWFKIWVPRASCWPFRVNMITARVALFQRQASSPTFCPPTSFALRTNQTLSSLNIIVFHTLSPVSLQNYTNAWSRLQYTAPCFSGQFDNLEGLWCSSYENETSQVIKITKIFFHNL